MTKNKENIEIGYIEKCIKIEIAANNDANNNCIKTLYTHFFILYIPYYDYFCVNFDSFK